MTQPDLDDLHTGFVAPHLDCAPMVRWWWFGPTLRRDDIDRQLGAMAAAGFGGVEVAYVYPLADATTAFCSPAFCADLRHAADRAAELGLRFDVTLGSGWSFGGPHITPELAARRLAVERHEIGAGPVRLTPGPTWPGEVLLGAYVGDGSVDTAPERWTRLPITGGPSDGAVVEIPAGGSPRQVMLVRSRLTGQQVKRAAAGAEGPVLDHYSAAATRAHLRAVGEPLLAAVPGPRLGSVFCDSLEVYGSDWTPELPDAFAGRHGYDLLDVAPLLFVDGPQARQVRADYGAVLTDLYERNFLAVCAEWAHDHQVAFRVQSYGTPPGQVSSYRLADGIEGEGWGWTELTQTKWAASAGARFGHAVVSSETWTWVHSPSLRATPLDLQGEAHEHFLLGINQLVGHGWPYSPAEAPGLGWVFYASGALDDRNAWWPAMPGLNAYLSRLSWLLRQGRPVRDILVHLPSRELAAQLVPAAGGGLDAWRAAVTLLGPALPAAIRTGGWDYDALDDACLVGLDPAAYPVVITRAGADLTSEAAAWLAAAEQAGACVLRVAGHESTGQITAMIGSVLAPDVEIVPDADASSDQDHDDHELGDRDHGGQGIGVVHRVIAGLDAYLVANTGPYASTIEVRPRRGPGRVVEWDAHDGGQAPVTARAGVITLDLAGYQARLIMVDPAAAPGDPVAGSTATAAETRRLAVTDWELAAPSRPRSVVLPHRWEDDPGLAGFSGTLAYRAKVTVPAGLTTARLDLGPADPAPDRSARTAGIRGKSYRAELAAPVREVARVVVNGTACGVVWAPPYVVDISHALTEGDNEIVIEVSNTSAARMLDPALAELCASANARDGRRFTLQDVSAATAGLSSGLLAVPTLLVS